jgi:hypothetical protein
MSGFYPSAVFFCWTTKLFGSISLGHHLFESRSQLVGARCAFHSALNAFKLAYHIGNLHSINQPANAFKVAIAAAIELNIAQNVVIINLKINLLTASANCLVSVLHFLSIVLKSGGEIMKMQESSDAVSKLFQNNHKYQNLTTMLADK